MKEYWHAWNTVFEGLPKPLWQLKKFYKNLQKAWDHGRTSDFRQAQLSQYYIKRIQAIRPTFDVKKEFNRLKSAGLHPIAYTSKSYPSFLKEINNHFPPGIIYLKGDIEKFNSAMQSELRIAVVGTRAMSSYGENMTRKIIKGIAHYNPIIISGMARGIDTVAHKEAITRSLYTIAVLGYGLNKIPHYLSHFTNQIIKNGALISEYPPNLAAKKYHFPLRNRIIAGLSRITTIVEAGRRSGALITAQYALDQCREVIAIPGDITSKNSIGTNNLIRTHSAHTLVEAENIIDEINIERIPIDHNKNYPSNITQIFNLLEREPQTLETLAKKSTLNTSQFNSAITQLEIDGHITKNQNGQYSIT